MDPLSAISEIASEQHGLITRHQMMGHGWTRRQIEHQRTARHLIVVHRGVYAMAGSPRTTEQRLLAATLATNGIASHRAGMYLRRLGDPPEVPSEVSVDFERYVNVRGVVAHRSVDLRFAEVDQIQGIPVTGPLRLLADVGAVLPWWYVERCIVDGIARGLFTADGVVGVRWELSKQGRTGLGALQKAMDESGFDVGPLESVLEAAFVKLCREHDLPVPTLQHEVVVRGRRRRIDAAWPDRMVAVEVDGFASRVDRRRFQDDRDRQNALTQAGWTVLRFTWEDVTTRHALVATDLSRVLRSVRHV